MQGSNDKSMTVLPFLRRDMVKQGKEKKHLTRSSTRSIPLADEEEALIKTLAIAEGKRPATLMRALMYRGLERFLRDRAIEEPDRTEEEIFNGLRDFICSNPNTKGTYNLMRRGSETLAKTGTR